MIKTVFVVGAGASTDFGFGVGTQLATSIRTALRNRTSTEHEWVGQRDALSHAISGLQDKSAAEIVSASETIRRGIQFSNSIDDFLHENRDNPLVVELGKLAIAHCISQQEMESGWLRQLADSRLESRSQGFEQLRQSWLDKLFRLLKRGHTRAEAANVFRDVSFVVFNYDRCIEQYLYSAVADALDLDAFEAADIVNAIPIVHVYGSLGNLRFQNPNDCIPFGEEPISLATVAARIRTYSEEASAAPELHQIMDAAKQVVFLGYAFHEQGMKLLASPDCTPARVFWTQYNVHSAITERVRNRFQGIQQHPIPAVCSQAIDDWQFSLMS